MATTAAAQEPDCPVIGYEASYNTLGESRANLAISTLYKHTWVEIIYLADEVDMENDGCRITSIAFNVRSVGTPTEAQTTTVYLGLSDKMRFGYNIDFVNPAGGAMQVVYAGTWTLHEGWNVFEFDSPFVYTDITKNLIIGVLCEYTNTTQWGWSSEQIYYTSSPNRILQAYSDEIVPDPTNMGAYRGNLRVGYMRPDIKICSNCCNLEATIEFGP